MSEAKTRITITVDPQVSAYAEHLVEAGHATSVSAAFNEAMAEKAYRDRRSRALWNAKVAQADPDRVSRMIAHVDEQLSSEFRQGIGHGTPERPGTQAWHCPCRSGTPEGCYAGSGAAGPW
jgi:hypothetical protein